MNNISIISKNKSILISYLGFNLFNLIVFEIIYIIKYIYLEFSSISILFSFPSLGSYFFG